MLNSVMCNVISCRAVWRSVRWHLLINNENTLYFKGILFKFKTCTPMIKSTVQHVQTVQTEIYTVKPTPSRSHTSRFKHLKNSEEDN